MSSKKSSLLLFGALGVGAILLAGGSTPSQTSEGGGYGFTTTRQAVGDDTPNIVYNLPPVVINEASSSNYVPQGTPLTDTKKASSSTPSTFDGKEFLLSGGSKTGVPEGFSGKEFLLSGGSKTTPLKKQPVETRMSINPFIKSNKSNNPFARFL